MKIIITSIAHDGQCELAYYKYLLKYLRDEGHVVIFNDIKFVYNYFGDDETSLTKFDEYFRQYDLPCDYHLLCVTYQTFGYYMYKLSNESDLIKHAIKKKFYFQYDSVLGGLFSFETIQNATIRGVDNIIQSPYGLKESTRHLMFPTGKEKVHDCTFIGYDQVHANSTIHWRNKLYPEDPIYLWPIRKNFLDSLPSGLMKTFNRMPIEEYVNELSASKISISLYGGGEHCFRMFETIAVRTCVIQHKFRYEIAWKDPFKEGIIPTFDNPLECETLINDLLPSKFEYYQKIQKLWWDEHYSYKGLYKWAKELWERIQ